MKAETYEAALDALRAAVARLEAVPAAKPTPDIDAFTQRVERGKRLQQIIADLERLQAQRFAGKTNLGMLVMAMLGVMDGVEVVDPEPAEALGMELGHALRGRLDLEQASRKARAAGGLARAAKVRAEGDDLVSELARIKARKGCSEIEAAHHLLRTRADWHSGPEIERGRKVAALLRRARRKKRGRQLS